MFLKAVAMAQFDLMPKMGPFLDRHLVVPLLQFAGQEHIYDETDLLRGQLEILSKTNMVDMHMDLYTTLYPDQEQCCRI